MPPGEPALPPEPAADPAEIAARIERQRRTHDPAHLWPESTGAERSEAYARLLAATRRVLHDRPANLEAPGPRARHATGVAAFLSGMGALLGYWIEQGRLAADPSLAALLREHLAHGRRRAARMDERLAMLLAALAPAGVVPVLLKGSYTGRRYFGDPGARPTVDIDLLVAPEELAATRAALQACGLVPGAVDNRPQREEWRPGGPVVVRSLELHHADNPWSVDLHTSLDRHYFRGMVAGIGRPDPSRLEEWRAPFGTVRVLKPPYLVAHLALHAGAHLPDVQLVRAVELVEVIRQDLPSGRLRWGELGDLLRRTGSQRFAYPGLEIAASLSPETVDPSLRKELAGVASPRMRRIVAGVAHALPFQQAGRSLDMRLVWASGAREMGRNLLDLLYPSGPAETLAHRFRMWRRRLELLFTGRISWKEPPGR